MKKRTLNQTWILCLRMWRWIASVWTPDGPNVHVLKAKWLMENRIVDIFNSCFFCEYDVVNDGLANCKQCPGILVDLSFSCTHENYKYDGNPKAFYKELLRLNRIREAKK